MSEVIRPSEANLGKDELTGQVRYLLTDNKPEALRTLTESVQVELGDPVGRKNLLRIASSLAFPESTENAKIMYQLMYVVGDQLLLREGESSQLDLEKIDKNPEYRNEQYNRIVSRIKVVGAEESSLVNTCAALMKEYDFDLVELDFAREWVKEQSQEPKNSSIPAPILEKDIEKEDLNSKSQDEQAALAELEEIYKGGSKSKPTEQKEPVLENVETVEPESGEELLDRRLRELMGQLKDDLKNSPEDKQEKAGPKLKKVELGPTDDDDGIKHPQGSLLSRIAERPSREDPYELWKLLDSETEKVSYTPKQLQEMAIKLKELEEEKKKLTTSGEFLSELEGDRVDQIDYDKKEIDDIFERVFGSIKVNGLFAQAFHGVDYTIVDGIEDHGKMVDLQKRLVQLGKECCVEGELDVQGQELHSIYIEAKGVLGKPDNNKKPKLTMIELFDRFSDLVKVSGKKEEKMTYSSQGLQEMAKQLEQLKLDIKAGEPTDMKLLGRLNQVFEDVFGNTETGLFVRALNPITGDYLLDKDWQTIIDFQDKLIELGINSSLTGKVDKNVSDQLKIIHQKAYEIFRKRDKYPLMLESEFLREFEKLVTVKDEEV